MLVLKASERTRMLAARRMLPRDVVGRASATIAARVTALPSFQTSSTILLYRAFDNEVETDSIRATADACGKAVYYPRICEGTGELAFVRVLAGVALQAGRWGIEEPVGDELFEVGEVALLVVPGVAFDSHGTRLGRGKGYYDRTIRRLCPPAVSIGLAFRQQLVAALPRAEHDEAVDLVATETEILYCADCLPVSRIGVRSS